VDQYGNPIFRSGHMLPVGVSLVQETTVFREYGPVAGNTYKISYDASPGFSRSWLQRQTLDVDARHYVRLASNGVLALRFKGFKSWGTNPDFTYFGGNSELRGYEYLQFIGQNAFFANAELRFPLIEAMLTPLGVLGGVRGVMYANIGGASFTGQPYTFMTNKSEIYTPIIGYQVIDFLGNVAPVYGPPIQVHGLRLVDGRASYGIGLETFLLGFPMHFDWSWKTLMNRDWEDALFASVGGSNTFRKVKFSFWIGYDF
jgi:outer membrane protein assembly factor BamA